MFNLWCTLLGHKWDWKFSEGIAYFWCKRCGARATDKDKP